MNVEPVRLSSWGKVGLALRVWESFAIVRAELIFTPLPQLVARLSVPSNVVRLPHSPALLSRAVHRCLRMGSYRPSCLTSALVLYRLLRRQGTPAELVIGLPPRALASRAHAWIELDGIDVGPPPGRRGYAAFARFS